VILVKEFTGEDLERNGVPSAGDEGIEPPLSTAFCPYFSGTSAQRMRYTTNPGMIGMNEPTMKSNLTVLAFQPTRHG